MWPVVPISCISRALPAHTVRDPARMRQHKLHQQETDRVERGDHRPLAQAHQAEERTAGDIGPGGAEQSGQVGAGDALIHAGAHDIGPDEGFEIRARCFCPSIVASTCQPIALFSALRG